MENGIVTKTIALNKKNPAKSKTTIFPSHLNRGEEIAMYMDSYGITNLSEILYLPDNDSTEYFEIQQEIFSLFLRICEDPSEFHWVPSAMRPPEGVVKFIDEISVYAAHVNELGADHWVKRFDNNQGSSRPLESYLCKKFLAGEEWLPNRTKKYLIYFPPQFTEALKYTVPHRTNFDWEYPTGLNPYTTITNGPYIFTYNGQVHRMGRTDSFGMDYTVTIAKPYLKDRDVSIDLGPQFAKSRSYHLSSSAKDMDDLADEFKGYLTLGEDTRQYVDLLLDFGIELKALRFFEELVNDPGRIPAYKDPYPRELGFMRLVADDFEYAQKLLAKTKADYQEFLNLPEDEFIITF